jgi:hypothetical protein
MQKTHREKKTIAKFVFEGIAVLELLAHAKAAPRTVSPYGLIEDHGPRVMLVKDVC